MTCVFVWEYGTFTFEEILDVPLSSPIFAVAGAATTSVPRTTHHHTGGYEDVGRISPERVFWRSVQDENTLRSNVGELDPSKEVRGETSSAKSPYGTIPSRAQIRRRYFFIEKKKGRSTVLRRRIRILVTKKGYSFLGIRQKRIREDYSQNTCTI